MRLRTALRAAADVDATSGIHSRAADGHQDDDSDDVEQSADDRDADTMLDYIEQFNELMEDKRYDEAAVHAANGPRGILRTHETMHRFAGECFMSRRTF